MKYSNCRYMALFLGIVLFLAFFRPSYAQPDLERQMLVDRYGNELIAFQNPITRSPHRIMGHGVKIDRYLSGAVSLQKGNVEAISRSFIADYKDVLQVKMSNIEFKEASQGSGNWYVTFQQTHQGVPVYGAYVSFTVDSNWNVILMGSDFHPHIDVSTTPVVSVDRTIDIAKERLGSLDATVNDQPLLFVFPKESNGSIEYHLTRQLRLSSQKPSKSMIYFIDATDGTVVEEWKATSHVMKFYGKVQGKVYLEHDTDPLVTKNFRHEEVEVWTITGKATSGNTNTTGDYNITWNGGYNSYWIKSWLEGPYVEIFDDDGNENYHEWGPEIPDPPIQHNWTWDIDYEETNVFYHLNLARDHVNNFRQIDFQVDAHVDASISPGAVALTDFPRTIKFNKIFDGAGERDIIYHEYGHVLIFDIYGNNIDPAGDPYSQGNAMNEGFPNYLAGTISNEMTVGESSDAETLFLLNSKKYPDDFITSGGENPTEHNGEIIGGALWDLRTQVGQTTADDLWIEAMEITPHPDTFVEFCDNMLRADDNDGNLSNGTPNDTKIIDAFGDHGIGPSNIYVPGNYSFISTAVDKAALSGTTVKVSAGTYSQSFNMKSGVDLKGSGAVTIWPPTFTVAATLSGVNDVLVEDITFGAYFENAVEVINSGSGVVFRNCDFQGGTTSGNAGIYVSGGSSPPTLDDCSFHGGYYGINTNNSRPNVTSPSDIYDNSTGVYCVNAADPVLGPNNNFSYPSPHNSVYDVYANTDVFSDIDADGDFWGYDTGGPLRDPVVDHAHPGYNITTANSRSTPAKIVVDTSPMALAQEKLRSGDRSGAKADFKTIIASSTSQQETRTAIHWVMFASQTPDEVEEALSYLNNLQNQRASEVKAAAQYVSISGLVSQGRPAEALSRIDQILRDHPTSPYVPYALLEKAFLLDYTYKDANGATEIFAQIAATYPDWTETLMVKAKLEGRKLVQGGAKKAEPRVSLSSFPNPANPTTTIRFELPRTDHVSMVIYNLLGQSMRTLLDDVVFGPGAHSVIWNGQDDRGQLVGSGMYIARLKANGQAYTRKLMLMR